MVKDLPDNGFKYLSQEFSDDLSELVKSKKEFIHINLWTVNLEKFFEDKLPDRYKFYSSFKDGCISEKNYLHAVKVWIEFKMNTMGDYHDLYLKIDMLLLNVICILAVLD